MVWRGWSTAGARPVPGDSATITRISSEYEVPELESLESAVTWLDRFLSNTINPPKLIDQLDPAVFDKGLNGKRASHIQTT